MLTSFYDQLVASAPENERDLNLLLQLSKWDERAACALLGNDAALSAIATTERLKTDFDVSIFLATNVYYPQVHAKLQPLFIPIASQLAQYDDGEHKDWRIGSALADLFGALSVPDCDHMHLFNYSESYRHMILSRNLFAQRGTLKLLAFLFSDDFLQDAVSILQYKTDILNHINRVFVDTPDFQSWRYSVRVMSLAGGYNEDRHDVEDTRLLCSYVTQMLPQFLIYFATAFLYGMVRFFPKRAQGKIPKWLRRRRALFTGFICGLLGCYSNTWSANRLEKMRTQYDVLRSQEMRRRSGAEKRGAQYQRNTYFDSNGPMSQRIWLRQRQDYALVGGVLLLSCVQVPKLHFPAFMGDVVFRWPFMPTLFPTAVGLPCTSRSFIPYLVFPFFAASAIVKMLGRSPYDWYVHQRYAWWRQYRSEDTLTW